MTGDTTAMWFVVLWEGDEAIAAIPWDDWVRRPPDYRFAAADTGACIVSAKDELDAFLKAGRGEFYGA
jgi:hypothetical protein